MRIHREKHLEHAEAFSTKKARLPFFGTHDDQCSNGLGEHDGDHRAFLATPLRCH